MPFLKRANLASQTPRRKVVRRPLLQFRQLLGGQLSRLAARILFLYLLINPFGIERLIVVVIEVGKL